MSKRKAKTPKVKSAEELAIEQEEKENLRYIVLIDKVRYSDGKKEINESFEEIANKLSPRISKLISKFNIPGFSYDDVFQEALFALRYKAIKDYDIDRGSTDGPAPFERFAILCIRRHLATEFKASYQNKKKVLNSSMSLDQEHSSSEEDLSLVNIIPSGDEDILVSIEKKERFKIILGSLLKSLTKFEKEVFVLYAQKMSYEEIANAINNKRVKVKVNIKGVDNALSRIKTKGKTVITSFNRKHNDVEK